VILVSEETFMEKMYSAFFGQEFSADLTLVVVWIAATIVLIYLPLPNALPVLIVFAFPLVFLIPGYCLIAALFPKDGDIGLIERIMLSIGVSIAVVPLIGLGLNFTPWGIQRDSIIISVTLFTWIMVIVAHYKRALVPAEERFTIPWYVITGKIRQNLLPAGERGVDRLLSIVLTIIIFAVVLATIYVIASPKESEHFSEFFILGENRTSANYPDLIITGHNYPMYIGVGNYENRTISYTIETWTLLMMFNNLTNSSTIMAMDPHDKVSLTLGYNKTLVIPYNLSLNTTGYNRVEFLLFNESVPDPEVRGSDRINASYRNVHLWVDVR
jgi:uncharacterized membrane protein